MLSHKNRIPIFQHHESKSKMKKIKSHVSNKVKVINTIYGLFCCLIGVVLITIEPFKACGLCGGPIKIAMESFLLYMYVVSIIVLLVMFVSISIAKRSNRISIKNHNGMNRRLSNFIKSKESLFGNKLLEQANSLINSKNSKNSIINNSEQSTSVHLNIPKITVNFDNAGHDDFHDSNNDNNVFKYTYDFDNGTGELYMRVGTGILSLCTMVDIGLNLVKLSESYRKGSQQVNECIIAYVFSISAEIAAFIFTFTQCFFIFKHANIVINKGMNISSIALCHLVCTNFCVTLRSIVHETVTEISSHAVHRFKSDINKNLTIKNLNKSVNYMITKVVAIGCNDVKQLEPYSHSGIQATHEKIAPYLFACIIEYSLLCLTVFYIIWENIDKQNTKKDCNQFRRISHQTSSDKLNTLTFKPSNRKYDNLRVSGDRLHVNNFSVDCNKHIKIFP